MSEAAVGGLIGLVFFAMVYIGTPIMADNMGRNWKLWLVLTFCLQIIATIILLLLPIVHRAADNPVRSDKPEVVPNRNNSSKKTAPLAASSGNNAGTGKSDKPQKKSYTEKFKREVVSTALTSG